MRRPRKSIFRRPRCSSVVIVYCVTMLSSLRARGTYSYTGRSVMTTPAAWVEAWRGMPSSALAVSMRERSFSSLAYISRSGFESFIASSSVMPMAKGTCFATASQSA